MAFLFMFCMNEFFRFGINMEDVDKHFPEESRDMNDFAQNCLLAKLRRNGNQERETEDNKHDPPFDTP